MITLPDPIDPVALSNSEHRTRDYVLPGLLPGAVGMIVAPGGTGKSFFQIGLALSVCLGPDNSLFLPHSWSLQNTFQGRAVILAAEEDQITLGERLVAFMGYLREQTTPAEFAPILDSVSSSLVARPLKGMAVAPELIRVTGCGGYEVDPEWREVLLQEAAESRILFLDPLRRFHSLNENDSAAMTRLVQMLEEIAHRTGCAIIIVHHVSKSSIWQDRGAEQQSARGSSALTDAVRWQVNLHTMSTNEAKVLGICEADRRLHLHAELAKINYGPPLPAAWFRRIAHGVLIPESIDGGRTDEKAPSRRRSL